jgi:hypothetical protein
MTRIVQQIGVSPFPLITHMTSLICGVQEPGKAHDQCLSVEEKETKNVKRERR